MSHGPIESIREENSEFRPCGCKTIPASMAGPSEDWLCPYHEELQAADDERGELDRKIMAAEARRDEADELKRMASGEQF